MANRYNSRRYKAAAIVFLVSLLASLCIGFIVPAVFDIDSRSDLILLPRIAFGLVSVATVPMAWRWLYRRDVT